MNRSFTYNEHSFYDIIFKIKERDDRILLNILFYVNYINCRDFLFFLSRTVTLYLLSFYFLNQETSSKDFILITDYLLFFIQYNYKNINL